jgi:hypothetical protein
MSGRAPSGWEAWAKRKGTNERNLLGKIEENCPYCAHCTWITVGKTNNFSGFDEFFCQRKIKDGKRVTVDMTGKVPEKCEHFDVRSKYATK